MRRGVTLGVLLVVLAACSKAVPPLEALPILVAGCSGWVGDTCEYVGRGPLRVVLTSAEPPQVDAAWIVEERSSSAGRWRLVLRPIGTAKRLQLLTGSARALLSLKPPEEVESSTTSGLARARTLAKEARAALRSGQSAEAERLLRAARDDYIALGRGPEAADQSFTVAYLRLFDAGDFQGALVAVADGEAHRGLSARTKVLGSYYRGLVLSETGDIRRGLAELEEARHLARLIDEPALVADAAQIESHILPLLGRMEEADALLMPLTEDPDLTPCRRAMALNNLVWLDILDELAGGAARARTSELLERARLAFESDCPDRRERVNVATNRLILAAQRGSWVQVRGLLRELDAGDELAPGLRGWRDHIEATLDLAEGRASAAEKKLRVLAANAAGFARFDLATLAQQGIAMSLERQGRIPAALAAYAEAEQTWRTASLAVPLGEGRNGFLERASQLRQRYLSLLVQSGHEEAAFEFARQLRLELVEPARWWDDIQRLSPPARTKWFELLAGLRRDRNAIDEAAAIDWSLPEQARKVRKEERERRRAELARRWEAALATIGRDAQASLPKLEVLAGELVLLIARAEGQYLLFAKTSRTLTVTPLSGALSTTRVMETLSAALRSATRVRVLLSPEALQLDLSGAVVGVPVSYSLGLPPLERCAATEAKTALVVGDPNLDLPRARAEAAWVERALVSSGAAVEKLEGIQARAEVLRDRLQRPGLAWVHYAGHAVTRGRDGRASALLLADGVELDVDDLMALERVPPRIILSACEAAAIGQGAALDLGLAQALILGGACEVLAAPRPVPDAALPELMKAFYSVSAATFGERLMLARAVLRGPDLSGMIAVER
ncbi:MAG: CHAT domain-containing protein [Myxococcota bacterium]